MKRKPLLIITLIALLCIAALLASMHSSTSATENITQQTLKELNALDAVQVDDPEEAARYAAHGSYYLFYESASEGYRYCFDKNTGKLAMIQILLEKDQQKTNEPDLDKEQLRELATAFVTDRLKEELRGELLPTGEHDSNASIGYTFEEILDGIPTGTSASVSFRYDGVMMTASLTYADWEAYAAMEKSAMLSEEKAIEIALEEIDAYAKTTAGSPVEFASIELKRIKEQLVYYIKATGPCYCEDPNCHRSYWLMVDVFTGETRDLAVSQ